VCVYREDKFILPDSDLHLKTQDEVVVITPSDKVEALSAFMQQSE
jgi:Trk K+ transport system NAD-binding subunit